MDIVGAHGDDLLAEVERGERLDHGLAALFALELVRARILEVRHHVVDRSLHRVGCVLMKLQAVTGIGHLGARDYETSALVENVHLLFLPLEKIAAGPCVRPSSESAISA